MTYVNQHQFVSVRNDIEMLKKEVSRLRTSGGGGGLNNSKSRSVTEGPVFKSLEKFSGDLSKYNDWVFNARRILRKYESNFEDILTWASDREQEITPQCLNDYANRNRLTATLIHELNDELYEWLAAKTWNCTPTSKGCGTGD